ncbi:MAG: M14 family zinc carboxypeptidase, partial [Armatimonadota bacterium]
ISKYTDAPDFWLVGYEEVQGYLRALNKARLQSVGQSAGGRPLSVAYYGPDDPRRTVCLTGGTHGTETEGVASITNMIKVFESGHDLLGKEWPELQDAVKDVGFYLMPLYNVDASARSPVKCYAGMEWEAVNHLHVGFWKNGQTLDRKRTFGPWGEDSDVTDRLDYIKYLGARFNDAGRLINRPKSRTESMAVETQQMLQYLRKNRIDCYMDLHSHKSPPWLGIYPEEHTSGDYDEHVQLFELTREHTVEAGGPELQEGWQGADRWFNSHFFSANLGIYSFTYEAQAAWEGNFPDMTREEKLRTNTYNGIYTIIGLGRALLDVPSPWS